MNNSDTEAKIFADAIFARAPGSLKKGDSSVAALHDNIFESWKWMDELPFLQFPSHWQVKIVPAFAGAVIRFRVRDNRTPKDECVSIYFDGYNNLGYCNAAYWEVYPDAQDDVSRFALGHEKEMLQAVEKALAMLAKRGNDGI